MIINDLCPILSCKADMINHLMHHYYFPRIRKYINRPIYALLQSVYGKILLTILYRSRPKNYHSSKKWH